MPMDDRPTRYNRSCLLDLDDSHGRIGVGSIFSLPSEYNLEIILPFVFYVKGVAKG